MKNIITKKHNIFLFLTVLFIIISTILLIYTNKISKKDTNTFNNIDYAIENGLENDNVYLEIKSKPELVYNNNSLSYYLASDNSHIYLIYISDSKYKNLINEIENNGKYILYGITTKPTNEIKKLVIDTINTNYNTDYDIYYYDAMVGTFMINNVIYSDINYTYYIPSIITIILSIISFVFYIKGKNKYNKYYSIYKNELDKINKELKKPIYDNKVIITNNYIIKDGINYTINRLSEIIYMYEEENINTNSLILLSNDNNYYKVDAITNSKNELFKIAKRIEKSNKEVIVGYSKESRQKIKNLYNIDIEEE